MSVINTNVNAMFAQNTLTSNSRASSLAMQQLSTGVKVNSAKDDAAGLAIGQNMTSQIRGLNQSVKNANDGISMLQTADGAMATQSDMLQRMNELAVQSATGTNSDAQRGYLNTEFQALSTQINKISNDTLWNGKAILSGGAGDSTSAKNIASTALASSAADLAVANTFAANTTAVAAVATALTAYNTATGVVTAANAATANSATAAQISAVTSALATYTSAQASTAISTYTTNLATKTAAHASAASATSSVNTFTLQTGLGGSNTTTATIGSMSSDSLGLTSTASGTVTALADISSQSGASAAVNTIANAIGLVNTQRANIGAVSNQLAYAADNMTNISSNVNASRSQIMDTDYAQTTTQLAKTQIIQQAATAMLAQANQQPQSVLALLK